MDDGQNQPIFIVGSPRSGTTLLRLILDSHPNISSGPETNFLPCMKEPLVDENWRRIKNFGFDKSYWHNKVAEYFSSFQMEYARKRGKKRWAEKSPLYTLHLDFINTLFPNCQIIHIIRDGRDVVASFRKRWDYIRAIKGVKTWQKHVKLARDFGRTISTDRYIELRYEDLVMQPENTMQILLEFLHEPWDPGILRYHEFPHDGEGWDVRFKGDLSQEFKDKSPIYFSQVGAGTIRLDPVLKALVHLQNGPLLRELGYLQ